MVAVLQLQTHQFGPAVLSAVFCALLMAYNASISMTVCLSNLLWCLQAQLMPKPGLCRSWQLQMLQFCKLLLHHMRTISYHIFCSR